MKTIAFPILLCGILLSACQNFTTQKENEEITSVGNHVVISEKDAPDNIIKKAARITPSERQLKWQQLELIAFLHFGINTFTDREWGTGKEDPKIFNPTKLDAEQWVKALKEAGFKQVILTAKHHDGFCLWPSDYTEHSVKNSLWKDGKGDVVRELSEAAKKYHMGFGIYLSPWDMNHPDYDNTEIYNKYFEKQLSELLTNYGQIDEVGFDGANGAELGQKVPEYHFDSWYSLIRKLQPHAVIAIMGPDVRWVGTETGYGRETEWSVVPLKNTSQERITKHSQKDVSFIPKGDMTGEVLGSTQKIIEANELVWYPAEADVSIRPGWFYHQEEDSLVKSPKELMDIYFSSVGRNNVLLVNVPPDKRGLIHENDINALSDWSVLRNSTFKDNLASNAKITSVNSYHAENLIDGKQNTYWTTKNDDTTAELVFDLDGKKNFNVLMLQENIGSGQRIEAFELAYWDRGIWREVVKGTTVGYKRLLRFNSISTDKVKLKITSSRLNPALRTFGLYKRTK